VVFQGPKLERAKARTHRPKTKFANGGARATDTFDEWTVAWSRAVSYNRGPRRKRIRNGVAICEAELLALGSAIN